VQKSNDISLKEALDLMLKRYKLEKKVTENEIMQAWVKCMGAFVAGNTSKVICMNDKVTIYLKSAVMRNEFSMDKQQVTDMLNQELGNELIKEIEFK